MVLKSLIFLLSINLLFAGFFGGGGSDDSSSSTSESNSTDNFAVRPAEFNISKYPKIVKSGSEFNLTVNALDNNSSNSKDYNETLSLSNPSPVIEYNETNPNCYRGNLSGDDVNFSDGEANITLRYSEVGDLNLTIKEKNGSEFAKVDSDDTNDSQRLIKEKNVTIRFIPHHFEVNASLVNGDNGFTYYDYDLNRSALIEVNITAQNENNKTTKNYNSKCYARNVEVNVSLNKLVNGGINISKIRYCLMDIKGDKSALNEIDLNNPITVNYSDTNFTTDNNGSTSLKIYFNFNRDFSKTSSPMFVELSEINVSDGNTSLVHLNKEGNATFYYGNLATKDIITYENEENEVLKAVVFDDNFSDGLRPSTDMVYFNWYWNNLHQNLDGNVSNNEIVVSSDYNASNSISGIDVNVTSISNGKIVLNLKRRDSTISFAVVHLLSPRFKWLWYSEYKNSYDISNNSTCLSHFCFAITYKNFNRGDAGTGDFKGTETNISETNITKEKIFR